MEKFEEKMCGMALDSMGFLLVFMKDFLTPERMDKMSQDFYENTAELSIELSGYGDPKFNVHYRAKEK